MSVDETVIGAARRVEGREGVAAAALLAVSLVETDARAFADVAGVPKPLIRFEGHYFDRLLDEPQRRIARAAGLSNPRAGAIANPAGQAARWAMLERAASIDEAAAYASTSWGLAQVMGAHWQVLGFDSPQALAGLARASADGQLTIAARFLKLGRLDALLEAGDHAGFARRYNGPGFRRNAYDRKIAAAHVLALRLAGSVAGELGPGSRGPRVEALQRALARHGFPLAPDGVFGPRTQAALRAFHERFGSSASPNPS